MKLIVGLGNPGKEYEKTRHNVGFRILDSFAASIESNSWTLSEKFKSWILESEGVMLAKPKTFMNLSGQAVAALLKFYKLNPETDLLIVSDDKDMVFGKLRLRDEGSSGGHKGLQSIIDSLGTEKFHRLKFGVGHENQGIPTDAFVLQKFDSDEEKALPELIVKAVEGMQGWKLWKTRYPGMNPPPSCPSRCICSRRSRI